MRRSGLPTVVLRGRGLAGGVALEDVASLEFELFESPLSTDTLRDGGGRAQEDKEQDSEDECMNKKFQHCAASGGDCTE